MGMKKTQIVKKLDAAAEALTALSHHLPEDSDRAFHRFIELKRELSEIAEVVERAQWIK